ncbi:Type I inositol 1,4,5-trisphosphate 5-phosphatase, partial [Ameca splendens]
MIRIPFEIKCPARRNSFHTSFCQTLTDNRFCFCRAELSLSVLQGKWSRKGFIRTRWALGDCAFDLVNIHLFHDADNVVAWEKSPSLYTGIRQKALEFVLHRITDQRYEKLPYFLFGDFNFRLDFRSLIE